MTSRAAKIEAASAYLAGRKRTKRIGIWEFGQRFGIGYQQAQELLLRAQLDRGEIRLTDVLPEMRRKLVDPTDLHALAAGPIMQIGELYLPAGKLSMEETKAREQANILSASAIPTRSAETGTGSVSDG